MKYFLGNQPIQKDRSTNDGRVILLLALLMFGGAVFMLGKAWYEKHETTRDTPAVSETELADLRFFSPENILDRIRKSEDVRFVDVRPRANFEANHLIDFDWLSLAEIATYSAPTGQLVIVVYGEENSNEQLKEIHNRFTEKKLTFGFLEGGIRNWIAQGGTVITIGDPNSAVDQTKTIPVTPEKVMELVPTLVRTIILDVRSERDYALGHIPGAINIPFDRLERDRSTIPSIGSVFVYGATNSDTFQAGTRLFDMGFFGLRTITGGFQAWKEKGLPIQTSQ